MENHLIDMKENQLYRRDSELLSILLKDRTSKMNIIWATDNYASRGIGYQPHDQITVQSITGYHGNVIKPRIEKSKKEQTDRIRDKAEVFTPSWVCNKQNNLVDNAWFGTDDVFNIETEKGWTATDAKIVFPTATGKTWQDYVTANRLEITCGEAPYLVSRYDAVTGEMIDIMCRIGLLDRKLRVVCENTTSENDWLKWTMKAYKSIYGYDWQGDNVLLARENLLLTFIDYYQFKFHADPDVSYLCDIATVLSWNIWQMDGLKFVIPDSCKECEDTQISLFDEPKKTSCPGCEKNDPLRHIGIYCKIKDWDSGKAITFVSLLKQEAI